jgi:hypothetical protein
MGDAPALSHTSAPTPSSNPTTIPAPTTIPSSAEPMTIPPSVPLTATLATTTPLTLLAAMISDKENSRTQETIPRIVDNDMMDITGKGPSSSTTVPRPPLPLVNIQNSKEAGQHEGSSKRAKGLAVVGTGLTEK